MSAVYNNAVHNNYEHLSLCQACVGKWSVSICDIRIYIYIYIYIYIFQIVYLLKFNSGLPMLQATSNNNEHIYIIMLYNHVINV